MQYMPWVWWLVMLGFVVSQIIYGVTLDRFWQPWYRRSTQPLKFWSVIMAQLAMLGLIAIA